jgi:spermidine synthase
LAAATVPENPAEPAGEAGSRKDSTIFLLTALLFFFSGASSLIYQVIWTRQMVFVFGSSTFATATVLSAFMGGLALGSFVAGKFADRLGHPFLIYGLAEGLIGIWALAAPSMFEAALPIYKYFYQHLHLSFLPFSLLRFAVVCLILLPPTACMGATLPLLSRFTTRSIAAVARSVGTLYAVNTFGAVAGSLSGGFILIPSFGLFASTVMAAAVNLLLAMTVTALACRVKGFGQLPAGQRRPPEDGSPTDKAQGLTSSALAVIVCFGISGAIAMVYEVAWTRALSLVIGSTTYAFTIMLSTFLIGIALGSLISARFADRTSQPALWFAIVQIALGLASIVCCRLFNYLPYWNLVANSQNLYNADLGMAVRFLLAGLVLLPVTLLLGAVFPLAVKACTPELCRVGRSTGDLYCLNTLGAIVGSFAAGFLIIPCLGGQQSLVAAAAANCLLGALLLVFCSRLRISLRIACLLAGLAVAVWAAQGPQVWDLHMLTVNQKVRRGLNYFKAKPTSFEEFRDLIKSTIDLLYWKDGICANVAVVKFKDNQQTSLFTSGHVDASDGTDMPTQALLAGIPLLLKPAAGDFANVGWGSGVTMGYALLFPIKRIVCVEIEPAVLKTSRFFRHVNLSPEEDPRLVVEVNDGRNYLLATDESFDIITSEPSNPWQSGVCNLYTREYFQICHDRLKPSGIFTMWWQCNEVSPENLACVFSALKKVFKCVLVFKTQPGDIAVCASDHPLKINLQSVAGTLSQARLSEKLSLTAGITTAADLAASLRMADDGVARAAGATPANTDDRNFIEFDLSKNYEQRFRRPENRRWMTENCGDIFDVIDWTGMNKEQKATSMAAIAEAGLEQHDGLSELWASESYRVFPSARALSVKALIAAQQKSDLDGALDLACQAEKEFPRQWQGLLVKGEVELAGGCPSRARRDLQEALRLAPDNIRIKFRLAQTFLPEFDDWYQKGELSLKDAGTAAADAGKALDLLLPVLSDSKFTGKNPTALSLYAAALIKTGRLQDGINALNDFLLRQPDDITALKIMARAKALAGDEKSSLACQTRASELSKARSVKLSRQAQSLANQHKMKEALYLLKQALKYQPDCPEALGLLQILSSTDRDSPDYLKQLSGSSRRQTDR